ncbi:unnamed protein product [Calypogeia fissa]
MALAVRTTGALLHRPVTDQSATNADLFRSRRSFFVAPGPSLALVQGRGSRRTEIPQLWCGKKRLVIFSVGSYDTAAVAASELSSEDVEHPKQELGELQDPHSPEESSLVLSSKESEPIAPGEGGTPPLNENQRWIIVKKKLADIISNAQKHSHGVHHIRHSLGVDLGDSRTGVAISLKGYAPRPLSVLQLKADKLIESLLEIAFKERADEFIVGLPISFDGKETSQSNKTRSVAGKLAAQAAQRGWRVYLLNEYGSSQDGLDYMLDMGVKKKSRKEKHDAYAALVLLHSYFNSKGAHVKLIVPKGLSLQERLCCGDDSSFDDFTINEF